MICGGLVRVSNTSCWGWALARNPNTHTKRQRRLGVRVGVRVRVRVKPKTVVLQTAQFTPLGGLGGANAPQAHP